MLKFSLAFSALLGSMLTWPAVAEPWYPVKCPSGYSVVKKAGPGHQYHCMKAETSGSECAYIYKEGACPMASPSGGPLVPCKLGTLPNTPNKFSCVYQIGRNTPVLACSPSTPACPPGYLLNTSGQELVKDCSTERTGKADRRKTCYKQTAQTSTKETDYKKPEF